MLHPLAVGLPGLAALLVGSLAFLVALISARLGRDAEARAGETRARRSLLGIAVQAAAFMATSAGVVAVTLDPLSPLALGEAAVIASLMLAAVALFVWAARTMGRNWSLVARTRSDHQLVVSGPFAHIRHPIYTALALLLVALAVATGHAPRLIVTLPLYALGTWLRIAEEERLLRAAFGSRYDDYAARVKRFLPGLL
ncbi:MAG: methyltransferase family protein [Sphingomonas sp.]